MTERRNNVLTFTCDRCKKVITTLGNGSENVKPYTVKHRNFVKLVAHDGAVTDTYDLCDFCLTAIAHFITNEDESTGDTDTSEEVCF